MADSNSVFISYRRSVSGWLALAVFQDLKANGIDAFYDIQSIDSGQFDKIILNQIAARPYFMPILTPGTLERCLEPSDWLQREIQYALNLERMIVPLYTPEFKFSDIDQFLPDVLASELKLYNAVEIPHRYFQYAMQDIRTRFLKPISLHTTPTPLADAPAVEQKIQRAASEPLVTEKQLSAQEYFERGFAHSDNNAKIAEYSEAIRLNPQYAEAYINRGTARYRKGDLDGAMADYSEAIHLNPQYAEAYMNRGIARYRKGDLDGAITDCNEAIRLNPQYAEAYINRGIARNGKGDLDGAITDYNEAIRLNPQDALAHYNRGNARKAHGDLDGAIADYNEAIHLNPQDEDTYIQRGLAYSKKSDYKGAIKDFQKALALRPDHPHAKSMRTDIDRWRNFK